MNRLLIAAWLLALAVLSFAFFPGHTFLQSDTQIYIPILDHLWNPAVLPNDIVAEYPHVSFTIYDEVLFALRHLTHLPFKTLLLGQQFVYRLIGIIGLYLLGTGIGLAPIRALLVTSILSLGAVVNGPAVLTVEYEPVPRAFALPFILFALGLIAHDHWDAAAIFAGIAFLFHPPTALAFWGIYLCVSLWRKRVDVDVLLIGAALLMLGFVIAQRAFVHTEDLFSRIPSWLEQLQRMRASYNWIELWIGVWWPHYTIVAAMCAIAYWRVRRNISPVLQAFLIGLPVIGVLSVPASYIFLSEMKLAIMPQLQPGRYLMFLTMMAVLLSALAALHELDEHRSWASLPFLYFCYVVPMDADITNEPASHYVIAAVLALATWGALLLAHRRTASDDSAGLRPVIDRRNSENTDVAKGAPRLFHILTAGAVAIVAFVPFYVIPEIGDVHNFKNLHTPDLKALSQWAAQSTPTQSMFQFVGFGRRLDPGIFRANSKRALFADWKGGGQINFLKEFAEVWAERWKRVQQPLSMDAYKSLGIDYVVCERTHPLEGAQPVYQNGTYLVYRTAGANPAPPSGRGRKGTRPPLSARAPMPAHQAV